MKQKHNEFTSGIVTDIIHNYKTYAFMDAEEAIEHYETIAPTFRLADKNKLKHDDMLAIENMLTTAYFKYSTQPL